MSAPRPASVERRPRSSPGPLARHPGASLALVLGLAAVGGAAPWRGATAGEGSVAPWRGATAGEGSVAPWRSATASAGSAAPLRNAADDDPQALIAAAGRDTARLGALAEGWAAAGNAEAAQAAWRAVLAIDSGDEAAHRGLGHRFEDGRWFESYAALSAHRREEARARLVERGEVRLDASWVALADWPFLRMGWERHGLRWVHPLEARRLEREERLAAAGAQFQGDRTWVPAEEVGRWSEGLWRVGEDWLTKDAANARHASLDDPWVLPSAHFTLFTTLDRDSGEWVKRWADRVHDDLARLLGCAPADRPEVLVVDSIAAYNAVAGGDPATGRPAGEGTGWSSMHYAFFAESRFEPGATPAWWRGLGVAYWDVDDPGLAPYGQHAVRHAAAQSFLDAVDPSWEVIGAAVHDGIPFTPAAFWGQKKLPLWLRYGAAAYVERWFLDEEAEDPWWARRWAQANLAAAGGPRPVAELLRATPDGADPAAGARWVQETGALVSFLLDGGEPELQRALVAYRAAFGAARDPEAARDPRRSDELREAQHALEALLAQSDGPLREYLARQ